MRVWYLRGVRVCCRYGVLYSTLRPGKYLWLTWVLRPMPHSSALVSLNFDLLLILTFHNPLPLPVVSGSPGGSYVARDGGACACINSPGVQNTETNGDGTPICSCQAGWAISADRSGCIPPCPANNFGQPGSCTTCPPLSTSPSGSTSRGSCTCVSNSVSNGVPNGSGTPNCFCSAGFSPSSDGSSCLSNCPIDTFGTPGSICTACPTLSTAPENTFFGEGCTCVAGSSLVDGSCVRKGGSQQTATGCQVCGTGTNPLVTPCVCFDPTTLSTDANGNCYSFPVNTYAENGSCTACPRSRLVAPLTHNSVFASMEVTIAQTTPMEVHIVHVRIQ